MIIGPSVIEADIPSFDVPRFTQSFLESSYHRPIVIRRRTTEQADYGHQVADRTRRREKQRLLRRST
jgi:hypothetical protein